MPAPVGLRSAVADAVTQAYLAGARFRAPGGPTEPDLILGLITRGVPMLRRSLAMALGPAGLSVRIGGVYCHGNPKVRQLEGPKAGECCELADLLIVTRQQSAGRVVRRSLLTQFKISTTRYGATPAQAALYGQWPRFKYWSTKGLTDVERNPHPKRAHAGGQFAEAAPCGRCGEWHQSSTRAWSGSRTSDWVDEVVDLILGFGGCGFTVPASCRYIGWSRMIEDLLAVTAHRTFSFAGKLKGLPAGTGDRRALSGYLLSERCVPSLGLHVPSFFGELPGASHDELRGLEVLLGEDHDGVAPPEEPFPVLDDEDDDRAVSVIAVEVNVERG